MKAFISERDTQRKTLPRDSDATKKRFSDINVNTYPGKFAFKAEKGITVNADNATNTLQQRSQRPLVPEFPREPRNTHPLVHSVNSFIERIKERNPRDEDQI
uniref:Uncharacterized protein n=1 Tax=Opuntia streptacantha TaxID=393608 RepID=A0A7C8YSH2_OPUST